MKKDNRLVRPNYKVLGPKFGKLTTEIGNKINQFSEDKVNTIKDGTEAIPVIASGQQVLISKEDVIFVEQKPKNTFIRPKGEYYLHTPCNFTKRISLVGQVDFNQLIVASARCGYKDTFSKKVGIEEAKKKIAAGKVYKISIPLDIHSTPSTLGKFVHSKLKEVLNQELRKANSEQFRNY